MKHRCAVCWEWFDSHGLLDGKRRPERDHEDWYAHAVAVHGAVLAEFGFERCQEKTCPGVEHTRRPEGQPRRVKVVDRSRPITIRGTTYIPRPLFPERSA